METCVKIGFAQISLAAQKIWVAQNLGWRGGGEGVLRAPPPPPPVRLWVLSTVSSIKHM